MSAVVVLRDNKKQQQKKQDKTKETNKKPPHKVSELPLLYLIMAHLCYFHALAFGNEALMTKKGFTQTLKIIQM